MNAPNLLSVAAVTLYVAVTVILVRSFLRSPPGSGHQKPRPRQFLLPALTAVIFQGISLASSIREDGAMNFSFWIMASLVILIVVMILLTTALTRPVEKLGVVIFPLAAVVEAIRFSVPDQTHLIHSSGPGMQLHIFASIAAYSLLNIAAVQALLLALQDRQLHQRRSNRFTRSLPPLQTMETLLFQMIATGFMLLTVSLISGVVFIDDLLAQHLAHKTLLSVLAWIVFAVLLWGRIRHGWRGQTAIRWTLGGFLSLMLAYFGTKLVLEIILQQG